MRPGNSGAKVRALGILTHRRSILRLSSCTPWSSNSLRECSTANDASDASPQALFEHVASFLGTLSLAYVHTIEGSTGAARDFQQGEVPFDYMALKKAYQQGGGHGAWMLNNAYDRALADQAVADGADLIAFGKSFIANPDLAARLKQNGPYNTPDRATFYGGLAPGYTDYPSL